MLLSRSDSAHLRNHASELWAEILRLVEAEDELGVNLRKAIARRIDGDTPPILFGIHSTRSGQIFHLGEYNFIPEIQIQSKHGHVRPMNALDWCRAFRGQTFEPYQIQHRYLKNYQIRVIFGNWWQIHSTALSIVVCPSD